MRGWRRTDALKCLLLLCFVLGPAGLLSSSPFRASPSSCFQLLLVRIAAKSLRNRVPLPQNLGARVRLCPLRK